MLRDTLIKHMSRYVPPASVEMCVDWIVKHNIHLHISHDRKTKYGDYRHPYNGEGHKISVNHNMNPYAFLLTFIHEVAHLITWVKYKNSVSPHGHEWKSSFRELLVPVLKQSIFPDDVTIALNNYIRDPAASSCSDMNLQKVLKRYDKHATLILEEIPGNSLFALKSNPEKIFSKGELQRKRYKCKEVNSRRLYLVSAIAEVILVKQN